MDQQIFIFIHSLVGKSRLLDLLYIFFATYFGYFLIILALYLIFSRNNILQKYKNFLFTVLALIISRGIIAELFKFFISRPRPFSSLMFEPLVNQNALNAFPSGHTVFYFTLAFCIYYLISKKWGYCFIGSALLIGLSRIFVGVHWPTDVLGGIVIAFLGFFITYILLKERKIKQS